MFALAAVYSIFGALQISLIAADTSRAPAVPPDSAPAPAVAPIVLTPDTSFDGGLDLLALDKMGLLGTLWAASSMLTAGGIRGRHRRVFQDLTDFVLRAEVPMHLQVDGDYLGHCETARLQAVPDAIRVVA